MDTSEEKMKRVAVVFCSHDRVHAGWAYDYGHLVGHFIGNGGYIEETGERYALALNWCMTSMLAEGRQRLIEDLKAKNCDKVLWLDTDMRFPRQALHMLLRHKDAKIVGVNYVSRRPPFRFTAATLDENHLETKPNDSGLVEVGHLGMGCVLMDMSIFANDEGPWFSFDWYKKETGQWAQVGEDVFFCREMRARGHKIYVDQELSSHIGHEGDFAFTAEEMARVESVEAVEA